MNASDILTISPCPFCGAEAKSCINNDTDVYIQHESECAFTIVGNNPTILNSYGIKLWKRRAELARRGAKVEGEKVRVKDGKCHAHCQAGCEFKVCGKCTYTGDDGCEGQYAKAKAKAGKESK